MKATNQITLQIPQDWNDITFNQWKQLIKDFNESNTSGGINILQWRLKCASIINNLPESELAKLTLSQLEEYFSQIEFLDNEPVKEIWNSFQWEGKTWKQIDFKDLSLAQWIDAEKFSSNILEWHQLIAIFYIKPDEYNDYLRSELAEFIDGQPCGSVFYLPSQFFFIQTASEMALQDYLERLKKLKRVVERGKAAKEKIMKWFGSKSSTTSPTTTSLKLIKSSK